MDRKKLTAPQSAGRESGTLLWKAFRFAGVDVEELTTLVARARAGDLEAYGWIVRRFQDMAYGYAYSVLGDFHLAEDAAQDAFIEAFRCLGNLRDDAAFPGWFRRIVFKRCDRLRRRRGLSTVPLIEAAGASSPDPGPAEAAERSEMRSRVLDALRKLPAAQREVTSLFYINGYSHKDIAAFLEVPVTTVNNRLAASRKRLRQRMTEMVSEELKSQPLPEEFPQRVRTLLALPRPLEIEGHPVRQMWNAFRKCFPDFELLELDEICGCDTSLLRPDQMTNYVYCVGTDRILRPDLTSQIFDCWLQKGGGPCRLVTVGRVFRAGHEESATHLDVHHQAEVLWVAEGLSQTHLAETIQKASAEVLPGVEHSLKDGLSYAPVPDGRWYQALWRDQWLSFGAGGMISGDWIARGGLEPKTFGGTSFAFGLERCAQIRMNLDDARKLWAPPHVPQ